MLHYQVIVYVVKVRITTIGQSLIMHIFLISTIYGLCVSDMLSYLIIHMCTNFYEILIKGLEIIRKNRKNGCMKTIGQSPQKPTKNIDNRREMTGSGKFWPDRLPTACTNAVKKLHPGRIRILGKMENVMKT